MAVTQQISELNLAIQMRFSGSGSKLYYNGCPCTPTVTQYSLRGQSFSFDRLYSSFLMPTKKTKPKIFGNTLRGCFYIRKVRLFSQSRPSGAVLEILTYTRKHHSEGDDYSLR